jgi:hypothetical protein
MGEIQLKKVGTMKKKEKLKDAPTTGTGEAIERLKYQGATLESEDPIDAKDITVDGQPLNMRDADFDTELEYEGYRDIEEYDNDEFSANVDDRADDGGELNFDRKDRPAVAGSTAEENMVDKQDHRHD